MAVLSEDVIERLQRVIESPRTKCEIYLSNLLNNLPPDQFDEMVNRNLAEVTPAHIQQFGREHFDEIDKRPNPPDGLITIDEIAEAICRDSDKRNDAILLYIWLYFDSIRQASDDFQGEEKAFDYMLTKKDFESYKG